uniref:Claudin 20 n=1 Tax=Salmo trutta TaxID=8032 RepID=A0A674C5H5_SALTR
MASSTMQILAFALALLGVLGATVATLLPNWKVSADVGSNIMTAISQMQGLWMDCTWYSTGVFSCTLKYSVLSLPAYLQTARTTMVLSCMMGCLGLCLAALGLKCTRWGGSHRAKGHAAIAAGGCFILAGILCLVSASWFTNEVITTFLDSNVPESSKYEPGGAVYVTFVSAGFLLASGVIFCLSLKREFRFPPTPYTNIQSIFSCELWRGIRCMAAQAVRDNDPLCFPIIPSLRLDAHYSFTAHPPACTHTHTHTHTHTPLSFLSLPL